MRGDYLKMTELQTSTKWEITSNRLFLKRDNPNHPNWITEQMDIDTSYFGNGWILTHRKLIGTKEQKKEQIFKTLDEAYQAALKVMIGN